MTKSLLLRSAESVLYGQGFSVVSVSFGNCGKQSDIIFIDACSGDGSKSRFVLKVFRQDNSLNTMSGVINEFKVMQRFYECISGQGPEIICPLPIALFESEWAYLMTFLNGETIYTHLEQSNINFEKTAERVIKGLCFYYEKLGTAYGDFHFANTIVDNDERVGFIDFTGADSGCKWPDKHLLLYAPSSIDMGYWLYEVAVVAKLLISSPRFFLRIFDFTIKLLLEAALSFAKCSYNDYLQEVKWVALAHLKKLKTSSSIKRNGIYIFGLLTIHSLIYKTKSGINKRVKT